MQKLMLRPNLRKRLKRLKKLLQKKFKKNLLHLNLKVMKNIMMNNMMMKNQVKRRKLKSLQRMFRKRLFNLTNIRRQKVKLPRLISRANKIPNWLINSQKLTRRKVQHQLQRKLLKKRKWPKIAYQHQILHLSRKTIKINSNLIRVRSLKRCSSLRGPLETKLGNGR